MHQLATLLALVVALADVLPAQQRDAAATMRLFGRIVTACREGVPAARVWVTDADGGVLGRTVADGDGYYQMHRLPLAAQWLCAEAPGRCTGRMPIAQTGFVRVATLVLEDGVALRGVLTLPDGTPAAGAAVLVEPTTRLGDPFDCFAETTTDAKGAWSLPAVPLRPRTLRAFVPGRPLLVFEVAVGHEGVVTGSFAAGKVEARRVTVEGAPPDAAVTVVNDIGSLLRLTTQRWPTAACTATCDGTGTAALPVLPVPHEVRIVAPGYRSMPIGVPCDAGEARPLGFRLTRRPDAAAAQTTEVRGRLVDPLGAPLASTTLMTRIDDAYGTTTTGADGSFTLALPTRPSVLFAIAVHDPAWRLGGERTRLREDGLVWRSQRADEQPLVLQAMPAAAIQGTLRRPDGVALATARVTLRLLEPGRDTGALVVNGASDAGGRVDIGGLPSGRYQLTAIGDSCSGSAEVRLEAGKPTPIGALNFVDTGEIAGTVRDSDGRPVAAASVVAIAVKGRNRQALALAERAVTVGDPGLVLTDREGRFRIVGVAAGDWRISLSSQPRNRNFVDVTVEGGRCAEIELAATR